jgi:maltooligosyltrehalose trehalohydrolase
MLGMTSRRLPVGAEVQDRGVDFRVWAPKRRTVDVVVAGKTTPLDPEPGGYFRGHVGDARAGSLYRFRLDGDRAYPDPVSRFQPEGPHGPSQVVDPGRFEWTDGDWPGVSLPKQVIYEMHVGTFTREGTWRAAAAQLEKLAGICTVIEMMPVADFDGEFGWGYDGVCFFAPTRVYGTPDHLRAFVARAHALGFGVIHDVVYNHLGPSGNYLPQYSDNYFSEKHHTDWGAALNYDAPGNEGLREMVVTNAGYWIDEFHFDGLRLDATQCILDDSPVHILREIGERVRSAAGKRKTFVVAENEPQNTRLAGSIESGGYGLDGLWNDDLHHSAYVALTGQTGAYFSDHRGEPQEFLSATKYGYLFQGQWYAWQNKRRGRSSRGLAPATFVTFLENHDQVANTGFGKRLHARTQPGRYRALSALIMLGPGTPMLFQGQEFASSAPFVFFAHHAGDLAVAVRKGRAEFMRQFPSLAAASGEFEDDDPSDPAVFARCKLDEGEREKNVEALLFHKDLFALRRDDPTLSAQGQYGLDGAVLAPSAFVLRSFGETEALDRLLLVNLGTELHLGSAAEPLLAPPYGSAWSLSWSSESPHYGGNGMVNPETKEGWILGGESAALLVPVLEP